MNLVHRCALLASAVVLALPLLAQAQTIQVLAVTQVAPTLPQYTKVDMPLLRDGIAKATNGRVQLTLASWPERNVNGPEALRLLRSGQVDIVAAPLTAVSGDVPILDGLDLSGMNADIRQARRVADAVVPAANKELERLGIRMVASYALSGQMLFCRHPIKGLDDLKGLKVRTNGPAAADLMKGLGAQPVSVAFGEVYTALERGTVDCAITGSGSGNGVKWPEVTTHLFTLPLSWSTSGYFVNLAWWNKLDAGIRAEFEKTFAQVQEAQWALAAEATGDGVACNVGRAADCKLHTLVKRPMVEVKPQGDPVAFLRAHLVAEVLPGWVKRCGERCSTAYTQLIAPITGIAYVAR